LRRKEAAFVAGHIDRLEADAGMKSLDEQRAQSRITS
jgi:hypothetical protein